MYTWGIKLQTLSSACQEQYMIMNSSLRDLTGDTNYNLNFLCARVHVPISDNLYFQSPINLPDHLKKCSGRVNVIKA